MKYRTILIGLVAVSMLYGCADGGQSRSPDRPRVMGRNEMLQKFVGKPVDALIPYLGKPTAKIDDYWLWGGRKTKEVPVNRTGIGPKGWLVPREAVCEIRAYVDKSNIMTFVYYYAERDKDIPLNCPNIDKLFNSQFSNVR